MFEFFDSLGNLITSIIGFVVNFFKNLISFFQIVAQSLSFFVKVVEVLPVPVRAAILCIVGLSVVFLILGRGD